MTINPNINTFNHDPYCDHLASPNPWTLSLSIFLVLGILFSYLPQHTKIITRGTSAGLSPWWVLLGTLSSIAAIANVIVLPTSQHDMACCKDISGTACAAALLGVVQVGVQWVCFMIIMILFLIFFPRIDLSSSPATPHHHLPPDAPKKSSAIIVGTTSLFSLLLVGILSTAFLVSKPTLLLPWANVLGITASILSAIQYLPQLYTTWRLQHIMSLSILTMMIQVPGSFLFAFSLWLRVGWQGWSTWCVYCVTGILQGGLLTMAIIFALKDRAVAGKSPAGYEDGVGEGDFHAVAGDAREPDERDPLLSGATRPNGSAAFPSS